MYISSDRKYHLLYYQNKIENVSRQSLTFGLKPCQVYYTSDYVRMVSDIQP
jgi:hypothetical protein